MNIFSESVHIEKHIEKEVVKWLETIYLPEVANDNNLLRIIFSKVVSHQDESGFTYSLQYYFENKEELQKFEQEKADVILKETHKLFGEKVLFFRTEMEVVYNFENDKIE